MAWLVLSATPGPGGDWDSFSRGAQLLFHGHATVWRRGGLVALHGGGLHLYARNPDIQIGPLPLVFAEIVDRFGAATRWLSAAAGLALLLPSIALVESAARRRTTLSPQQLTGITLTGGLLVAYCWVQACVQWRHLDDVGVAAATALAIWAIAHERPWLLGAAIGIGIGAKPTALVLVPLLLALPGRQRWRAIASAGAVVGCVWLPFVVADPATLGAGVPQIPVEGGSGLTGLGYAIGSSAPSLLRLVQLAAGLAAGCWLVRRHQWWSLPMVAFAVRFALDPGVASYYTLCLVLGCLAADLHARRAVIGGWRTLLSWAALALPYPLPGAHHWIEISMPHQADITLAGCAALVVAALVIRSRSDDRAGPQGLDVGA